MENFSITLIQNEKDPQNIAKNVQYDINDNGTVKIGINDYSTLTAGQKATYDAFVAMVKALPS